MTRLNANAMTMTDASTTGLSFCRIAVIICVPMPGRPKTVSVTTAPPKLEPNAVPTTVITGMMAFFSACLKTTLFSVAPFARAVRIKS